MALQLRFIEFKNFSENWESVRLNYLIKSESSKLSINELEENTGDYPLYGASGFIKNIDFYEKEEKYIAIVKDGSGVGNSFLHEGKSSIVSTMQYLINTKNSNLVFDYYLIQTLNLEKYVIGSSIPHIYFKDYGNEKISIPPLEEQEKISNFLSAVDKKIDLLNCKLKEYNLFKKGLLQQIFGRLAKKLQFKMKRTKLDYDDWVKCNLADISLIKKGFTPSTNNSEYWGGNISWLSIADMKQGKYIDKTAKRITLKGTLNKKIVKSGSLVMSFKLTIGKLGILTKDMYTNEAICNFEWKNNNINTEFMYYYLNSINILKYGSQAAKGITLNNDTLNAIPVTLPPLKEQEKIANFFSAVDKKIDLIQAQIDEMEKFKKGLLQQMFI